jgi:hypothetical protein
VRHHLRLALGVAIMMATLLLNGTALGAGTVIYDNIPHPTPGNVPSVALEATQASEWGDRLQFAAGPRTTREATVLMSSWGCESGAWYSNDCVTTPGATFTHSISLTFYAVGPGNSVGAVLGGTTQSFAIPYRPSASPLCVGVNAGKWFDASSATCFNGLATPITFNISGLLTLTSQAIVGVAYNTTHYGYNPIGESTSCYTTSGGCGYDSLNIGTAPAPTVGVNPAPSDAYYNSASAGQYCDGGAGGVGIFRLDAGCWAGFKLAITVTASFAAPQSANDCKKGGWESLSRADGSSFKNQGDCIQYFNTGK